MRVAIVGGGVIGLAIGWRARTRGMSVTIIDPEPGSHASWVAAGMLAPVSEVHYGEEDLLQLTLASLERYPAFVDELQQATGRSLGYVQTGTLTVARDRDDNAALDELFEFQRKLGLDVRRLRGRECRQLEPALAPRTRGGILVPGDHQIDNRRLVDALRNACVRAGVAFVPQRASAVTATSVLVGDQMLDANAVVVATGAYTPTLAGLPEWVRSLVRPVKGQILRLAMGEYPLLRHTVRGLDCYLVPRPHGELVVGATEEDRGYDTTVTAGAVHDLLRAAYELLPGVTELQFSEALAALRPGSPDNAPLLGPVGTDGPVLATGHYRNGILLTPITAMGIVALLEQGSLPDVCAPFVPDRLEAGDHEGHRQR